MVVLSTITAANFVFVVGVICSDAWRKVTRREASVTSDVIAYALCSRTTDASDRPSKFNDVKQSIFDGIWT